MYILNIKPRWFLSAHSAGFPVMPDPEPHQVGSTVAMRRRGRYTPSTPLHAAVQPMLFPGEQLAGQSVPPHEAFHAITRNTPFYTDREWLRKYLPRLARAQSPPSCSGWPPQCHRRNDRPGTARRRLLLVLRDSVLTGGQGLPCRK